MTSGTALTKCFRAAADRAETPPLRERPAAPMLSPLGPVDTCMSDLTSPGNSEAMPLDGRSTHLPYRPAGRARRAPSVRCLALAAVAMLLCSFMHARDDIDATVSSISFCVTHCSCKDSRAVHCSWPSRTTCCSMSSVTQQRWIRAGIQWAHSRCKETRAGFP